jgi:oligopeptide/dipeptide ABC transporter ATP-binding protein
MSTLLITHDLSVVAEAADVVGVMYAGQIVEMAPALELFSNPLHPYTLGLMGAAPARNAPHGSRLTTIPGTVPSPGDLPPGCAFAPRCPRAMPQCSTRQPETVAEAGHQVACRLYAAGDTPKPCHTGEVSDHVSIHNRLHPPIDSVPADRNRVDCPLPEGRGYRKCAPDLAGSQANISLKGEVSDHKGNFDKGNFDEKSLHQNVQRLL